MVVRDKNKKRRARRKRSAFEFLQELRRLIMLVLAGLFVCSAGALGLAIFSRTVPVDESALVRNSGIVFEEPDPPAHETPVPQSPAVEIKRPQVAIIIDDMGYLSTISIPRNKSGYSWKNSWSWRKSRDEPSVSVIPIRRPCRP